VKEETMTRFRVRVSGRSSIPVGSARALSPIISLASSIGSSSQLLATLTPAPAFGDRFLLITQS